MRYSGHTHVEPEQLTLTLFLYFIIIVSFWVYFYTCYRPVDFVSSLHHLFCLIKKWNECVIMARYTHEPHKQTINVWDTNYVLSKNWLEVVKANNEQAITLVRTPFQLPLFAFRSLLILLVAVLPVAAVCHISTALHLCPFVYHSPSSRLRPFCLFSFALPVD